MDTKSFQTVEAIDREEWQRKYFALLNQTVELQAQRDALLAACQALRAAIALTQKEEA